MITREFPLQALASVVTGAVLDVAQHEQVGIEIYGTFVGTVSFFGSLDGVNFVPVFLQSTAAATLGTGVSTATAPGIFFSVDTPFKTLRVDCTAYTSGTINMFAVAGRDGK